jgi:hypothetical protein
VTPTATPTATPTGTPTATPTPSPSDCLCEVVSISPGAVALKNVGNGGKGSKVTRNVNVSVQAVDAPGARCNPNESSEPTSINLRMVDDGGHVIIDRSKTIVCSGRPHETFNVKIGVTFRGPDNCKDGLVPATQSNGEIATTATGSAGTTTFVETTKIKCRKN